jgi:hypothetical protein
MAVLQDTGRLTLLPSASLTQESFNRTRADDTILKDLAEQNF